LEQETYRIYAIRYARLERRSSQNFIGGDGHDFDMPLDYYVWAIVGDSATYVVDTGFDAATGAMRNRDIIRPVREGLAAIGVEPATVRDVILTHLHYDHAGNHDLFPSARYHVQDREMAFCTGRHMCHGIFGHHYECADVQRMVANVFAGRVVFHDGFAQVAPGIELHRVGGHTAGLQVVRVRTARGWVVLASDAAHFRANLTRAHPFPAVFDLGAMLEGFALLRGLAASDDHIIPGHDPEVLDRYPAASAATKGWIARVDLAPPA